MALREDVPRDVTQHSVDVSKKRNVLSVLVYACVSHRNEFVATVRGEIP